MDEEEKSKCRVFYSKMSGHCLLLHRKDKYNKKKRSGVWSDENNRNQYSRSIYSGT